MISFQDMGVYFFENLEKIKGGAQLQNPVFFEVVVQSGKVRYLWKGEKKQEFKPDIIFVIWVNFWVMTFWPIFWPWNWLRGSN